MAKVKFEEFIDFLSSIRLADFPDKAKERASWNILDTIGAIIAGGQEQEIIQLARRLSIGNDHRTSTALVDWFPMVEQTWAAFLNGSAGVSLEMDPGHRYAMGHPSVHVLPAILAMAEREHRPGADLLLSYLIGYETASRLGVSCMLKPQFHAHGVFGTVGASVACAYLGGARGNLLRQAMNIACSFVVTNSWENARQGATVRNACAGVAGHFGILAWEMAASGFTGLADALAETFGHLAGEEFSCEKMVEGLGEPFEIERFYTKLYGCCGSIHPTLDALDEIRRQKTVDVGEIEKVIVRTYSPASSLAAKEPANSLASRFSIPYAAAVLLVTGECMPEYFSTRGMEDPCIRELARKVDLIETAALTARLPEERCSEVEIRLRDGTSLSASRTDHRGSYTAPHSSQELEKKFLRLTVPVIGEMGALKVMQRFTDLEKVEDICALTSMIRQFRTSGSSSPAHGFKE